MTIEFLQKIAYRQGYSDAHNNDLVCRAKYLNSSTLLREYDRGVEDFRKEFPE